MNAKTQHYVPRLLLRNFTYDAKKRMVQAYDKHESRSFPTNIINFAAEGSFYDFELEGKMYSLESVCQKIEDAATPLVKNAIENKVIETTKENAPHRASMAIFMSLQLFRTR